MTQFVHLHLHTQYSLLDGVNRIPDCLEQAHSFGHPAIAMTDHGNLHGAIEFYLEAKRIGIKPIIGCELYLNPVTRFERKVKAQGGAPTCHLTVLATNNEGYLNLCKLVTLAYREGFYFKPRVDHELLKLYNKGLVVLSGCMKGEFAEAALEQNKEKARKIIEFYATTFKGRYFLEIQPHGISEQGSVNAMAFELAKEMGLPLVATTDCHYANKDDHFAQEVLMCISTGRTITDRERIRHEGVDLHLKQYDEMRSEFSQNFPSCNISLVEEALRNSVEISKCCNLEFDFSKYFMPKFTQANRAAEYSEAELVALMSEKAQKGLERRLDTMRQRGSKVDISLYNERLKSEISMIAKMGFAGYFLVVSDFIVWAKENKIPVGPGRGSVAGSLVAYAMRITELDPIEHKLIFERFLNPDRVSLPDIDVDFCINGRDKVIQYVVEKYGKDKVAQILTFGTLKAKAAIKDVGRALNISYAETDRIAQLVPAPRQGFDFSLSEALKMEKRLADYAREEGKQLIELALKLEGLTRHTSTHAAGVVIGDRPLTELLPLMVDKDGNDVTQYSMSYVEKIGLAKFDFLGLKTLTVIHTTLRLIAESRGIEIDLEALNLNDSKTYALLCAGNTTGVFQLESTGITEMTMRLKPNCFDDIVAILALYRPGPLDAGMVEHYIARKHGREPVTYLHALMKGSLSDTYAIILYQEQIMQLARELAGYSLAEADLLRKAMGKKNPEEMAKHRDRFVNGAAQKGISKTLSSEIFNQMETFARYGFNRSHSAAYAMISFQTAYLKAHYNVEFMAALMSHEMDDSEKTLKNINECKKQKIKILPPDLNSSVAGFSVSNAAIRFGLEALKGVGEKAVQAIIAARQTKGNFTDLEDFVSKVDLHALNRRTLESLIKCGAFDFCKLTRRELFERLEDVLKFGQSLQRETINVNQLSLFGASLPQGSIPRRIGNKPEWPINKKLGFEREALGFYISGHPLEKFVADLKRLGAINTQDLKSKTRNDTVRIGGVVTALRLKNTKKGDRYATFTLEDVHGTVEAIVWPNVYKEIANLIVADDPFLITGKADITEERKTLIVDKLESLIAHRDRTATQGMLSLSGEDHFEERMDKLLGVFGRYSGKCPVKVKLAVDGAEVVLALKDKRNSPVCVDASENLCEEIEQFFGRPVLSFF